MPPTRARDLLAGAVVLLVTLSLVRLAVDREMTVHVASLRAGSPDSGVWQIEHLRRLSKAGTWLGRLAVAVAVAAWMGRARRIVQSYDCDLYRTDPDMAVWGFFLPPFNVFAPYVLMADVWTAAHPSRPPDAMVDRLPVPRRIGLWWGLFLLSVVLGAIEATDLAVGGGTWAPFDAHLDYVMTGSQIVSAVLLLWIVVGATGFIERRYAAATSPA